MNLIDDRSIIWSMSSSTPEKRRRGRPPKDDAAFNDTKAVLIRSGLEVLTERGYSAIGIDEILRRVGVPKGSFYHYFNSKSAFGAELIESYANFMNHRLDKFLLDESLSPIERLTAFTNSSIDGMARYGFKKGCLVGNLGQEVGALPESFRAQISDVLEGWQLKVEQCLVAAKVSRQISAETDCKEAAYLFWSGWEGAVMRAKLEQSPDALQAFSKFFLSSIQ